MLTFAQVIANARNKDTAKERIVGELACVIARAEEIYGRDWECTYDLIEAKRCILRERQAVQDRWREA